MSVEFSPNSIGQVVNRDALEPDFPTHHRDPLFWEELGRLIATFGFLEWVLGRAIYVLTATRTVDEVAAPLALEKWEQQLKVALTGTLKELTELYDSVAKSNRKFCYDGHSDLVAELNKISTLRNALCHGAWGPPDELGDSPLFFVNKQMEKFDTKISAPFLKQTRLHVREVAIDIINVVTSRGYTFPGAPPHNPRS